MCHVIYLFFGSSLGKVRLCQVSSFQDMSDSTERPIPNRAKLFWFVQRSNTSVKHIKKV